MGAGSDGDESIPPFLENPSQSNQGKAVFVHRFSSIPGDCVAPTRIVLLSPCRNHWIWNVIAWQLFFLRCDAHTSTTSADVARAWPVAARDLWKDQTLLDSSCHDAAAWCAKYRRPAQAQL